ncbi:PspC domain-containing protein [Candidatus Nomurabacteria bacterium RIFCSPHIGHO2_02_FULL_37_45]|uniref:PspC domain-containing protein n=2 Tax=Candidatus Nomuraibacteriota TaxID=1752729 RepID=A0A1F6Y7I6_9BACT|nr:MAG: PspC domain-containing protein [Candidatus Nomurabacteria bacterium RIFCSPHIGHO2_02_FULL_37_45]OGI79434.1 MAG: PspC domain-containing protein [Candidatus Nomurabacteria bacterium RIFCSPHIGHO2_12_FULL_37_29]OGI85281.1 MAG: PspC domain-containing protein [Candidatus Nomurabacteria bacterium RIFCSPLOWO2_01_FULL_37_49]OGJ02295.1 MAG: PspC domain-containing protein [Candidatus Nomurabacteria bacterium RIFCSPLOWO2_12_FULL_37_8]
MTKRLYKSDTNKVFAGVIGGIGEYFDIDPTLLRLAYILIAILTAFFPAVIGYLIACIVVPKRPVGKTS